MARKRKGLPISGWLVVDKPAGLSSSAVVGRVRRITGAAKAGHGGTLDPLATGILPIALGEATKTVNYVVDGDKVYTFSIRFGEERTTDDAEGEVSATSDARPTTAEIEAALPRFTGTIEQVPPAYSAIKVDGRRAYELARADQAPDLAARPVEIREFRLLDRPDPDTARFEVRCGKGAYMRSLARDLSRYLDTVGHIVGLRRTRVGPFAEKGAISLDNLEALGHSAALAGPLLPVETVLDDIPALALTETEARCLRHGQPVAVLPIASRSALSGARQGDVVKAMNDGRLVALAEIKGGELRPLRVINP